TALAHRPGHDALPEILDPNQLRIVSRRQRVDLVYSGSSSADHRLRDLPPVPGRGSVVGVQDGDAGEVAARNGDAGDVAHDGLARIPRSREAKLISKPVAV